MYCIVEVQYTYMKLEKHCCQRSNSCVVRLSSIFEIYLLGCYYYCIILSISNCKSLSGCGSTTFRSPLVVLPFPFAVCSFSGKNFVSSGRHSWHCKSNLHRQSEFKNARSISSPLLSQESMNIVTNGCKIVT